MSVLSERVSSSAALYLKGAASSATQRLPRFDRRIASRVTSEDAVELARYDCKFPQGANEYIEFIKRAMA